jgi:hypothetical protein
MNKMSSCFVDEHDFIIQEEAISGFVTMNCSICGVFIIEELSESDEPNCD